MSETLTNPAPTSPVSGAEIPPVIITDPNAGQAVEQGVDSSSLVVEGSNGSELNPSDMAATDTVESGTPQEATNARVQQLINVESIKLGSRTVERAKLDDILYQDAVAKAASEGHDVSHLFEADGEGRHSPDNPEMHLISLVNIQGKLAQEAADTQRKLAQEAAADLAANGPATVITEMEKARMAAADQQAAADFRAQEAADKLTVFNTDGSTGKLSLTEAEDLSPDQKAKLRDAGQAIGDRLSAEEASAEAAKLPGRRERITARIRSLIRNNKIIEGPSLESSAAMPVFDAEVTRILTEAEKADLDAVDQKRAAETLAAEGGDAVSITQEDKDAMDAADQQSATERRDQETAANLAPFNPDGTPAKLSLDEAGFLSDAQKAELRAQGEAIGERLNAEEIARHVAEAQKG